MGAAAQDNGVPTLHVYPNLVRVPVLVLGEELDPLRGIAASQFYVSLDSGPWFRVPHVRPEGDDPLSLAIVLDLNEPAPELEKTMDAALAGWAPGSLTGQDRVSIYAMDCELKRSATAIQADPGRLKQAVDSAQAGWMARGRKMDKECLDPANLWDSLDAVTQELQQQADWRAVLVVTDGVDHGSHTSWNELQVMAEARGVAIFGLTQPEDPTGGSTQGERSREILGQMCEATGGVVLRAYGKDLPGQLRRFTNLLRSRYIAAFPHPVDTKGGYHDLKVKVAAFSGLVLHAGASVPVDDPKVLKDPTTVPLNPADAPQLGKRKVVSPN
jgi:VWFA-related protein